MKFICPICETGGSISPDKLVSPITKTTCQKCGTILLANPDSGKIDAYKSPFKGTGESDAVGSGPTGTAPAVLEMRPPQKASRDWTAIVIVITVLIVLIAAGIYTAGHLDILRQSFQSAAELIQGLLGKAPI